MRLTSPLRRRRRGLGRRAGLDMDAWTQLLTSPSRDDVALLHPAKHLDKVALRRSALHGHLLDDAVPNAGHERALGRLHDASRRYEERRSRSFHWPKHVGE